MRRAAGSLALLSPERAQPLRLLFHIHHDKECSMPRVKPTIVCALALIAAIGLPAAVVRAQTTANGSVRGVVTDEQGASIPGVLITATSATVPGIFTATTD